MIPTLEELALGAYVNAVPAQPLDEGLFQIIWARMPHVADAVLMHAMALDQQRWIVNHYKLSRNVNARDFVELNNHKKGGRRLLDAINSEQNPGGHRLSDGASRQANNNMREGATALVKALLVETGVWLVDADRER